MKPELVGVVGIIAALVLLFLRMHIGLSLILVGFLGIAYISSFKAAGAAVVATIADVTNNYTLTVLPLFVFMGAVAAEGGIAARVFDSVNKWIGHVRGGLAVATIAGCAVFGAICGSSAATTATFTKVTYPQMKRYGYKPELSTSVLAAAGPLAVLIPPSLAFVLYAILTSTSLGKLFIAGIIPGIILAMLLIAVVSFWVWKDPKAGPPARTSVSMRERWVALRGIIEVAVLFIAVIGGLYTGTFTPTEAGTIGATGAIVATLSRRTLTWKQFNAALSDTMRTTGMILLLMVGGFAMSRFVALSQVASWIASLAGAFNVPPLAVIGIIIVIYLILGCVLDTGTMVVVTVPIFHPLILQLGFDSIWFGVLVVVMMEIAVITPPVGMNVWIVSGMIPEIPMWTIFRGIFILLPAEFVLTALLVVFPQIALFLPGTM